MSWKLRRDRITNKTSGKAFEVTPLPRSRQAIIEAGGLIPYTRQRLVQGKTSN